MKYFSNSISFTNKKLDNIESLKNRYLGATVYPKKTLSAKRAVSLENKQMESRVHLPRYTIILKTFSGLKIYIKNIRALPRNVGKSFRGATSK